MLTLTNFKSNLILIIRQSTIERYYEDKKNETSSARLWKQFYWNFANSLLFSWWDSRCLLISYIVEDNILHVVSVNRKHIQIRASHIVVQVETRIYQKTTKVVIYWDYWQKLLNYDKRLQLANLVRLAMIMSLHGMTFIIKQAIMVDLKSELIHASRINNNRFITLK